jgi:hypothetical protein
MEITLFTMAAIVSVIILIILTYKIMKGGMSRAVALDTLVFFILSITYPIYNIIISVRDFFTKRMMMMKRTPKMTLK